MMGLLLKFGFGAVLTVILGIPLIPFLKRLKAGQSIREEGPGSHMVKAGTPTMGGIMFLGALLLGMAVFRMTSLYQILILLSTLGFGAIGFIDDYIKVIKKRNLGLRAWQKMALQIGVSLLLIVMMTYGEKSTLLKVPFTRDTYWDFGHFYVPFMLFVFVGTVNSVNLTDGLDGLSSGVTIIVLLFFTIVAKKMGLLDVSEFSALLAGSLLGFLWYNHYPAKAFMGDTGSLALGGAVAAIAMVTGLTLYLPFVGGIYFAETLSVIIQVVSFKTRGKRVFLMSPLHHHFEEKGWKETKVVYTFYGAGIVLALVSGLIL